MSAPTDLTKPLIHLTIDGRAISVPKGTTVYQAAKQLEIDIPIFCYHDRMPPFGACRMCLVEVEKAPKLQTSCTLEATEGMVVKTKSSQAIEGREEILEFLLINHPLDCPICDRGGECPLQEHVFNHGPGLSRFFEEKRHFKKPWPLGPVLMLDRERCIVCARCTRFGDLIAGDHALELLDRNYQTQVGAPHGGPAESKFIGNTIMLCPVGALTSQVYRFRARPWDNEPTNSACALCPVGCDLIFDSRDGEIMRARSRENKGLNDIWLCDKGWFGYEFTSHPDRLKKPLIRRHGQLEEASWQEAVSLVATKMAELKPTGKIGALGGNPLTIEENYLFQQLIRESSGFNHVDHRVGEPIFSLEEEGMAPGMEISIGECEELSFVVLLGVDLTEEFPVIWLRLKQAINKGATVVFIGHYTPEISRYLSKVILHAPGNETELLKKHLSQWIEQAKKGKKAAFFVGRQYLATSQRKEILSCLDTARQNTQISLNLLEGRGNSFGARLAGMRPDHGPFNRPIDRPGMNSLQMLENASTDGWGLLYVAGANPSSRFPSELWKKARENIQFLVVQDLFLTETARQADVVFPTLSFVEKGGRFINIEGRAQALLPGKSVPDSLYSDGEIFALIAKKLNKPFTFDESFLTQLKSDRLSLKQTNKSAFSETASSPKDDSFGGSLRATFAHSLFDQGVRMNHNPHASLLTKQPYIRINPHEAAKRMIQDNERVTVKTKNGSLSATIKLEEGVAVGVAVLPLGFEKIPVHDLGKNLLNGLAIDIQKEA